MTLTAAEYREGLQAMAAELGEMELEVAWRIIGRLYQGQERYGPLEAKMGEPLWNWAAEQRDEFLDAAIYGAIDAIRRTREGA